MGISIILLYPAKHNRVSVKKHSYIAIQEQALHTYNHSLTQAETVQLMQLEPIILKGSCAFGDKADYTYDLPDGVRVLNVTFDKEDNSKNTLNIGSRNGNATLKLSLIHI